MKKHRLQSEKKTMEEFYQLDKESLEFWRDWAKELFLEKEGKALEARWVDFCAAHMLKFSMIAQEIELESEDEFENLPSEEKEFWIQLIKNEFRDLDEKKDFDLIKHIAFEHWCYSTKSKKEIYKQIADCDEKRYVN